MDEDEEQGASVGVEHLDVLLEVGLLQPCLEADEGSEAAAHLAALVAHFVELREEAVEGETEDGEEALGDAQAGSGGTEHTGPCGPFAAELRSGWWQQLHSDGDAPAAGAPAGSDQPPAAAEGMEDDHGDGAAGGNPRDRIFGLALPSDWQAEAPEPAGLSCTLFRYQRRCLAWLKWRESLYAGDGGMEVPRAEGGEQATAAAPDPRSCKAALPAEDLRWQPLVLPSGLALHFNPLTGCVRRGQCTPALPEVPGGLLCDEMGLGKTVEMMALFLANPPPEGLQQQRQPGPAQGQDGGPSGGEANQDGAAAAHDSPGPNGGAPLKAHAANQARADPPASSARGAPTANGPSSSSSSPAPRGGTLVVCPPALLQQWQSELANHAHGALVVEVYDGLRGLQEAAAAAEAGPKRLKPAQREAELYARLLRGEAVDASFDAAAEAVAAVRRMQAADVVLTSFDVLRAEVYFVPTTRSFRRPKKYAVPHCPLLQLHWWRLVIDEAQMVGPLSAAGTMCERMMAVHRWCVTGTPMGAHRNELQDIHALLHTLQHQPFADVAAWRLLVADPIAAGSGPAARQAWSVLSRVLRPLMWRNTKGVVAQEFHLPARSLHPVWLRFQPGERAFYEQVVERTREAREQLESFHAQQAAGSDGEQPGEYATKRAAAAAARSRKARAAKQGQRLESAAVENVTQLRLACVHPQLTRMWKDMQAEGQVGMGATLSMEEIMQRLVDSAQNDLQEAERELCAHLNTLAMLLLAKADAPPGSASKRRAAGEGAASVAGSGPAGTGTAGGVDDDSAEGGPPAKRARKSKGGFDVMGREALREEALLRLEQSFRVAEKGIAALHVGMDVLKGMPDIEAASSSTVNAWKRLQINTASQLARVYGAAGREEDAQRMERDAQEKMGYLRAQAQMEATSAQQRVEQLQQAVGAARHAFRLHLEEATRLGFIGWGITRDAERWLEGLEGRYHEAQELESAELEAQEGKVKAMLGKRVSSALDEVEKQLHGELTQLDRYVGEQHAAAGYRRLAREQHSWDRAAPAAGPSAGGGEGVSAGEAAVVAGGVRVLWDLLKLLPDFRRKTLQAQHVAVFSKLMAEEAGKKAAEAARRKAEAESQKAAAAAAAGLDGEVVEVEGAGDAAEGAHQQPVDGQEEQQERQAAGQRQGQQGPAAEGSGKQDGSEQKVPAPQELAAVLAAVDGGSGFAPSSRWLGRVKGYVFKLGGEGLGYYRDAPPVVEATLAQLHVVAAAVSRALQEHQRRLAKAAGPEAALFSSLSLDAVEAKLESVKQQIQLVRSLRECHVAERSLALKAAVQADLDADLRAAAEALPVPGASADRLAREVERLRDSAQALLHRKRYMASRVSEARQLQGGGGGGDVSGGGEGNAPQQEGQGRDGQQGGQQGGQQASAEQQQQQPGPRQDTLPGADEAMDVEGWQQQDAVQPAASPRAAQAAAPGAAAADGEQAAGHSGGGSGGSDTLHAGAEQSSGVECPVCLTLVPAGQDIHVFSVCGHAFCRDCAAKLVLLQGMCAVCRQKVTRNQVFRVAASGARSVGASDPEFEELGKIQPQGEWSAKVEALLRRLLHLQTTSPAEKALVFSQFPDALKLVALALQTNGIKFVQLLGGRVAARKAVASFREDEEVRVFLLSHRAGAAGLTLVRASRVFLLEPALEPAIEQQAVARVHRIGQQRPVVVTRLLVQDSIERRVLSVQEAKHALFSGADGAAEDTAELATTVEAPVRPEALGQEDLRGLLEGM